MSSSAYELKGVSKMVRLGDREIPILQEINLHISLGEYVAIMGPSGSGKSTLMHLLGCLDTPSDGELHVLGNHISQMSDDEVSFLRSETLGFVFQAFHLLPSYDALSNVAMPMVYSGKPGRWERSERLLRELGLGNRLYQYPRTLSGGEKQRVAIARALANDPPILLADEPTGALDQASGRALLYLLDGLHHQEKTIVLVTHDPNIAKRAQRVVELVDGKIRRDIPIRAPS